MRLCFYESSHAQGATGLRSDQDERVGVTKVKVAITKATRTDEKSGENCRSFEATPSITFQGVGQLRYTACIIRNRGHGVEEPSQRDN